MHKYFVMNNKRKQKFLVMRESEKGTRDFVVMRSDCRVLWTLTSVLGRRGMRE